MLSKSDQVKKFRDRPHHEITLNHTQPAQPASHPKTPTLYTVVGLPNKQYNTNPLIRKSTQVPYHTDNLISYLVTMHRKTIFVREDSNSSHRQFVSGSEDSNSDFLVTLISVHPQTTLKYIDSLSTYSTVDHHEFPQVAHNLAISSNSFDRVFASVGHTFGSRVMTWFSTVKMSCDYSQDEAWFYRINGNERGKRCKRKRRSGRKNLY